MEPEARELHLPSTRSFQPCLPLPTCMKDRHNAWHPRDQEVPPPACWPQPLCQLTPSCRRNILLLTTFLVDSPAPDHPTRVGLATLYLCPWIPGHPEPLLNHVFWKAGPVGHHPFWQEFLPQYLWARATWLQVCGQTDCPSHPGLRRENADPTLETDQHRHRTSGFLKSNVLLSRMEARGPGRKRPAQSHPVP